MKYTYIFIFFISLLAFQLKAQEIITTDLATYSNHTSNPFGKQAKLPNLTQARTGIETKGKVTVSENTKVIFKTLSNGFIHLNGQFQIQKNAFFQAHKADFTEEIVVENNFIINTPQILNLESYPNPFADQLFLNFQLHKTTKISISLFDIAGNLVYINSEQLSAGYQKIEINTQNIVAGLYNCQIVIDGIKQNVIVVKVD